MAEDPSRAPAGLIQDAGMLRVIVYEQARSVIDAHVAEDTTVECGGVLVGDVVGSMVEVRGAIPARRAVGAVTSLTFTHEAWDEVNAVLEAEWGGQKMVGWYHSHPGFGIFLSEYDQFIQSNFFSEPWQVAYVADPLLRRSGVFGWREGEIARHSQWAVVVSGSSEAVSKPDRPAQPEMAAVYPTPPPPPSASRRWITVASITVIVLLAAVVGYYVHFPPSPAGQVLFDSGQVRNTAGISYRQELKASSTGTVWTTSFTNVAGSDRLPVTISNCAPSFFTPSDGASSPLPDGQARSCVLPPLRRGDVKTFRFTSTADALTGMRNWIPGVPSVERKTLNPFQPKGPAAGAPPTSGSPPHGESPVVPSPTTSAPSRGGTSVVPPPTTAARPHTGTSIVAPPPSISGASGRPAERTTSASRTSHVGS